MAKMLNLHQLMLTQAFGMALLRHWIFKRILYKILPTKTLRVKMFIPVFKTFTAFVLCKFCTGNRKPGS